MGSRERISIKSLFQQVFKEIRNLSERLKKPLAVLQDLAGPKIRIGQVEGDHITLETGSTFTLTHRKVQGNAHRVSHSHPGLAQELR